MFRVPDIKKIERQEKETKHFSQGLNFYKLFWIFFIGCFLGVVVETLWCICTRFHYESRVGLIYGPFNLVYGFGAVAMAAGLYWMRERSDFSILCGGIVIGTIVEYICSVVQEIIFGSISWNYSEFPFNLNGRVNLLYSLFWGILAIIWIKWIYPTLANLILKIPNKIGKRLTWILCLFMVFNTIMSGLAVERWTHRREGKYEMNIIWGYFDKCYSDERMETIYPNMNFK